LIVGLLAAVGLTRLMEDLLFGVTPLDAVSFATAPLIPESGVNCLEFSQKWPIIEDSSQIVCSSRLISEDAASVPQRF